MLKVQFLLEEEVISSLESVRERELVAGGALDRRAICVMILQRRNGKEARKILVYESQVLSELGLQLADCALQLLRLLIRCAFEALVCLPNAAATVNFERTVYGLFMAKKRLLRHPKKMRNK